MAGYVRQDTTGNISTGNIIEADDLNAEFNAVVGAFDGVSGHKHDGTSTEGAPIEVVGPAQDVVITSSVMRPKTDNTIDLGTSTQKYKDLHSAGTAFLDAVSASGNATVGGTLSVTGLITASGGVSGDVTASNVTITGGSITGTAINTSTINNTVIGGVTPAAANFTTVGTSGSVTIGGTLSVTGLLTATGGVSGNVTGDLTGNVTGDLTGNVTGNASTATALQTARNFTIGATARSFNGTANVSWSLADIGVNNATLTLATSGIATGSQTFTANQGTNATFTVNVPATNLTYSTAATTGTVNSSTGTNTTIPAATTSLAGLMTNADKTKLDGIAAGAQVNVGTNLGQGGSGNSRTITSSTGNNVTVSTATTSNAGFMSTDDKTKLDGIAAGAQVNVGTNLSWSAGTTSGPTVNSSTGSNATMPTASATASGAVTTGNQTWAGTKTFSAAVVLSTAGTATTQAVRADRTITAGTGLTGGGNLTADRTINISNSGVGTTQLANLAVTTLKLETNERMTTANVLAQTAGAAAGAVGTYAVAWNATTTSVEAGGTIAGSGLRIPASATATRQAIFIFVDADGLGNFPTFGSTTLSGTWRAIVRSQGRFDPGNGNIFVPSMFLRIA